MKRFWNKVKKTTQCWLWTAARNAQGYGWFSYSGRPLSAHRMSWGLVRGEIPKEQCVLHKCDNRICVRPSHLFLGDRNQNNLDKVRKGRQPRHFGELNPNHKLTEDQVRLVRSSKLSRKTLARRLDVTPHYISKIRTHKLWKETS